MTKTRLARLLRDVDAAIKEGTMSENEGLEMLETSAVESDEPFIDPNDAISGIARLTTENEWATMGTQFHPSTRADKANKLPPGVYRYAASMQGWWLDRTAPKFEFPFKVYHASGNIIERVSQFWKVNGGNLGILMNGLRGAGKTMTAQLLANKLIEEEGLPVLVVRGPVPLQVIFDAVQQHMMVIFDEFEKTHDDQHQQALLSTIDGMSRSANNRLIVFTTNRTEINENFRDRPSRIHYKFEFRRVADEIIEGLINDSLPQDLMYLKPDIIEFLHSRKICTIDIVKAVIAETITFRESPTQFEDLLNIAKGEPPAYTVEVLAENGAVVSTFSHFFKLRNTSNAALLSGNPRSLEHFQIKGKEVRIQSDTWDGSCQITLCQKDEEEHVWLAKLSGPLSKTPFKNFFFLDNYTVMLDNKPDDWKVLPSAEKCREDEELREEVNNRWYKSMAAGTAYGTGEAAIFRVRIKPQREMAKAPARYKQTARGWDFD